MESRLSAHQWDQKVFELGGSILQSWAWGEFQKSLDQKIYRFEGENYATLAIESQLPLGKKYIYCPRGPVGEAKEVMPDFRQFEKDHNIIFVRCEPQHPLDLPRAAKEVQPPLNWVLDIEKTEVELLNGMKPKTRYNINLAQRKGVRVYEGSKADLIKLWELFLSTASRGKFKLHTQNYYWQMYEHLEPDHLKIVLAEYQGKPLAGMLLTLFGDTATYLHGGSSSDMKEAMAPFLLHWEAIKISKQAGIKHYDFGGISSSNEPNHGWAGISRFKKGFGGFEVVYPGTFDLVFSPIWYNIYKNARTLRKILNQGYRG